MSAWIEWFGTLASVVVAISLTMRNIKRLRVLNLLGSLAFAAYGWLIQAWPVFGLNAFIVVANTYYLYRMGKEERDPITFEAIRVDASRDDYARRFLSFHGADIRRFFPGFDPDPDSGSLRGAEAFFILRQTLPVSLVAFRRLAGGELEVVLDYAVPAYRDLKNARFFFDAAAAGLAGEGSPVFSASAQVPAHAAYLRKLGFKEYGRSGDVVHFRKAASPR